MKLTFGSNLCVRPQNCVFKDGSRADPAIFSNDRAAAQLCARINCGGFCDTLRPPRCWDIMRPPMLSQNHTMHVEIRTTRANIEPFSVVHYQAADLAALADPITDNREERNFTAWRNSLENLSIPNSDGGKVVITGNAVPGRYIDDAVIAKSHISGQTGFASRRKCSSINGDRSMFVKTSPL